MDPEGMYLRKIFIRRDDVMDIFDVVWDSKKFFDSRITDYVMINNEKGIAAGIVLFKHSDKGVFFRTHFGLDEEYSSYEYFRLER
jgi:hypothetical protein